MMQVIYLAALAGTLSLDVMAVAQIMVSRPVVAGAIIGYAMGDLKSGFYIGALIELIWISVIPVGLAVPPDVTVSAVISTSWYLLGGGQSSILMLLAIMLSIPVGVFFKWIDVSHRKFNVKLARIVDKKLNEGDENIIIKMTFFGVLLFFIKAFLFFLILIPAGAFVFRHLGSLISKIEVLNSISNFTLSVIPAVGLGVLYSSFKKKYEKA
ncbi:MAG: PTS sugar transporter subunit IIC [Elusimicrobiota bacterium]